MLNRLFNKKSDPLETVHTLAMRGIANDWTTVWLQVECEGSRTSVDRFVATKSEPAPKHVGDLDQKIFGLFADLSAEAETPWTSMTLRYDRDDAGSSKFKADVGYAPVPVEEQYERRIAWKKLYMP